MRESTRKIIRDYSISSVLKGKFVRLSNNLEQSYLNTSQKTMKGRWY